ncbi:MAG: cysteine desulfurase NifS [Proteobacteria bacterium]|nr:cysteine desulfurase NifS [Pseudomonadota bacterium]
MKEVYVDNNATTRIAPEVKKVMLPFFGKLFGNPSSIHRFGEKVAIHFNAAREQVASFLGAEPEEIIFTSCGTESNNAAIRGTLDSYPHKRHIVTTAVEHPAVLNLCHCLEKQGYEVTELSVDRLGNLDLDELQNSLRDDTAIVSIMYANNETGVIFPIEKIAQIVKSRGIVFHCDAVQAAGKIPINLSALPVDLLSVSGHKLHAPKGIGILYIRKGSLLSPFLIGGHQEMGRRAGTENVPYIVGMAKACELAKIYLKEEQIRVRKMRDRLEEALLKLISNTRINGDRENRLSNTLNISFEGVEGESILLFLNKYGIGASSGSACTSGSEKPSHVLRAMEIPYIFIHGSLRFSLSRYNTDEEIDYIIGKLPPIVSRLRELSPLWPVKV